MSNSNNRKALELLFDRPLEPVFTTRDNGKAVFDLPESYYNEDFVDVKDEIKSRFSDDVDIKIPLRDLPQKPDLHFTRRLGKRSQFSLFNKIHQEIAGNLVDIFMSSPNEDFFISTCAYCKDRVNPFLFQYCYSVAVQHRKDTKHFPVKPIAETFPQNFIEPGVFKNARAEGEVVPNAGDRRHIEIPRNYTASDRENEQRLAYFREDIGVNSHHWHWHLVYPGTAFNSIDIVKKDRRGELFYYMHHQILARYNVERFCNDLAKVRVMNNMREPIVEGYYPKIMSSLNNRTYPGRNVNTMLSDIDRDNSKLEIADIERWVDRIVTAIDQAYVVDTQGKQIPLDPKKGIDILGDIVESTVLSVNPNFYGNLHNEGHNAISFCHDPEARFLEDFGVMGDVTTAMRDPIFYRWHGFIDTIFNRHKERLSPYGNTDLAFNGVVITKLVVAIQSSNAAPNTLLTYRERSDVNLAAGLDFGPKGNIYATFTHLQHAPFEYVIEVANNDKQPRKGTCRIFLCPKSDERGTPLNLNDQRQLAIELDKFTVTLMPGVNSINHSSHKSSVTIPYERTFRPVGPDYQPTDAERLREFQFCGCGWPEHMLLPKGKPEGMIFDLFAMISDFAGDVVQQSNNAENMCGDSASFCGLKDKLYPDNRSMGYPFDRRFQQTASLSQLIDIYTNMKTTDVVIRYNDVVVDRKN